jgi:hypothetical protein
MVENASSESELVGMRVKHDEGGRKYGRLRKTNCLPRCHSKKNNGKYSKLSGVPCGETNDGEDATVDCCVLF